MCRDIYVLRVELTQQIYRFIHFLYARSFQWRQYLERKGRLFRAIYQVDNVHLDFSNKFPYMPEAYNVGQKYEKEMGKSLYLLL